MTKNKNTIPTVDDILTGPNHKLTKEQFDKAIDENTSRKEFKELSSLITERFTYIIYTIAEIVGRDVKWHDFDNEGGNEYSPGSFDPSEYSHQISYTGDIRSLKNKDFDTYDGQFPSSWLFTDFEESLKTELQSFIDKKQAQQNISNKKANDLKEFVLNKQNSILAKLSDEEKLLIGLNSPDVVQRNVAEFEKQKRFSIPEKKAAILDKLSDEEKLFISFHSTDHIIKNITTAEKQKNIEHFKNQSSSKKSRKP